MASDDRQLQRTDESFIGTLGCQTPAVGVLGFKSCLYSLQAEVMTAMNVLLTRRQGVDDFY
ncbi:hypothetical protein SM40611_06570 [Xanthomonas hortorum pv. gardneri]|nr:hypothetical protein SM40611_06570 [Xanthomonas hortorum pv. gardneri]